MIELVAIGDEVLYGYTINRNAAYMAQALLEAGFSVNRHSVVSDESESVKELLSEALKRNRFVIATGGLGPTCDDATKKIVAELFNVPLVEPEGLRNKLLTCFGGHVDALDEQCLQPKGAYLFENTMGSASGFALCNSKHFPNAHLICLPGVPAEMQAMFDQVICYVQKHFIQQQSIFSKVFHFHSVCEYEVDLVLRQIQAQYPHVAVGIYPGFSVQTVHLKCRTSEKSEVENLLTPAKEYLLKHFGQYLYTFATLMQALHNRLIEKNITLATAESCTGGGLAKAFVLHPDASKYFQGSVVCYTNDSKTKILHVPDRLLNDVGPVSCEVTEVMARSVQELFSSSCSIAVSGILGPTGGMPAKPVGTVCASICLKENVDSWTMHLHGSREAILEQAIQAIAARLYKKLNFI